MVDVADAPYIKPDRPTSEQILAWKRLTFVEKLGLADQMRSTAILLRETHLRQEHPDLSEAEIRRRVREFVLYGGA